VSSPWHRQLQKVFSYSRIIYIVNPHSRPCSCLAAALAVSVPSILCSPSSFPHSISSPVSSPIYSISAFSFPPRKCQISQFPRSVLSRHFCFKLPCPLHSPSSFTHSISLPVPSTVYSVSSTSKCTFLVPGLLLSKVPITALYRCLPDSFPSKHHVHCICRPRFPILLALQSDPVSTPCHRQLQKVFSKSLAFYLVNPHSRPRIAAFPELSLQSTMSIAFAVFVSPFY
jgi:hypothetical protein